jgi:hypothetical protein|tara:strand:+ start:591 stop:773 length:183 start_codon:yes stop_codon:yes gene_type:complete
MTDYEIKEGMDEEQRKDYRKTAKRIIKVAKKHPEWYTREDVQYAKLIKRVNKKKKPENKK